MDTFPERDVGHVSYVDILFNVLHYERQSKEKYGPAVIKYFIYNYISRLL